MSDTKKGAVETIFSQWHRSWRPALDLWSPYTRLKKPVFCMTADEEKKEGLTGSFAMIRLSDLSVVVSLRQVKEMGLDNFPMEVLAHEIGHHVYCPADYTDLARMTARMRRALPTRENMVGMICNLYSDLMINDRLFREQGLKMDRLYSSIAEDTEDELWNFYMRIYEILWSLPRKTLTTIDMTDEMEGDAQLGNSLIRHYARDWLSGAGRFAALCLTYLLRQEGSISKSITSWLDTINPGKSDSVPSGLTEIEDDEISGAVHPAMEGQENMDDMDKVKADPSERGERGGNFREPYEYGEILSSVGIHLDPSDLAIRYYRERSIPYLVPFPSREMPGNTEPLPEGLDVWEPGSPLEQIDWVETALRSPVIIPGYTTLERQYGTTTGTEPEIEPIDLDIYVDCSGSMPNPAVNISYPALAGTIICLSALRSGSRVQATLWSGKNDFRKTDGFVRNEHEILGIVTGYIGGSTAFPVHILRQTYEQRKENDRKVHILVISDEGIDTILMNDEKGNTGAELTRMALEKGNGGGTLVLNLYSEWKVYKFLHTLSRMGYDIYRIEDWSGLVDFSSSFAKKHYRKEVV